MKKILIIFILIIIPIKVNASKCESYLNDLSVEGYEITPKFDKHQNNYSIWLEENADNIIINYEKNSEENGVIIKNNKDLKHLSIVDIEVGCSSIINTYKIMVNKIEDTEVFYEIEDEKEFNTKDKIITIIILSVLYLFILYTTWYLVCKKKKKTNVNTIKDSEK